MKKNLIAIIALTAALAASTSAFADTVQISEEELNKPVSTYAGCYADTGNSRRHYAFER